MNDELVSRLQRWQRISEVMRGLMREAQDTAPASTRAKDATGAVTVILDAEGFPLKITMAADWRRRLRTRALGAAVMEANGAAALARMKAWTRALQEGVWARKVEAMMATGPDGVSAEAPDAFRRKVKPRPLGDLSDEMVRALDSIEQPAVDAPRFHGIEQPAVDAPRFHGINRGRTVTIILDAYGMSGCVIDGVWAARQSAAAMSAALGEALAAAKTQVQAAVRAAADRPDPARAVDSLLDEAMSLLQNPMEGNGGKP